jgi:hypothetical protein
MGFDYNRKPATSSNIILKFLINIVIEACLLLQLSVTYVRMWYENLKICLNF